MPRTEPQPLSKMLWMVRVKGARKIHLTPKDESGKPIPKTLCGKDASDRTSATIGPMPIGNMCKACCAVINNARDGIHGLGISEEAVKDLLQLFGEPNSKWAITPGR